VGLEVVRLASGRELKLALLALAPILGSLLVWAGLMLALGTSHPLLIVSGTSMEPTLHDGDLVVVRGIDISDVQVGDIVAFYEPGTHSKIIIHRVVDIRERGGEIYLKTKGDNNERPDRWLVGREDLIGKMVYRLPGLGHVIRFVRSPVGICIIAIIYGLFLALIFRPSPEGA